LPHRYEFVASRFDTNREKRRKKRSKHFVNKKILRYTFFFLRFSTRLDV